MFKKIVIFVLMINLCCGETEIARKKKPHHHHLYHIGILYYLTFLAVKVKIVILIGAAIMAVVFFGKIFALLRYGIYNMNNNKKEPERIIIEKPYHDHSHGYHESYDEPGFSSKFPDRSSYYYPARNMQDNLPINLTVFADVLKKINLTELTFKSMGIVNDSCKRRTVCEANIKAKGNSLMKMLLWFLNDKEFKKYKEIQVNSIEDCYTYYSDCVS